MAKPLPRYATMCAAIAFLLSAIGVGILLSHRRMPVALSYVGSNACRSCHASESDAWKKSHHQAAMAPAADSTVLGRFDGPTFFKRDGKFFARTEGSDGKLAEFEIRYTFGVYPLQQYLVALSGGRLQALTTAWDARPAVQGGQRWLALYPESRSSDDELHWTRPSQNWNYMCADCHSTGVRKNYVAAADSFHTTWSEISVGCEACHGPGSRHIAWAAKPSRDSTKGLSARLDERRGVSWIRNASTGNATRSHPRNTDRELQVCAQCHSRRSQISDGYVAGKPFYDYYRPALLSEPLYHADGQQRGEVYEWGSFLQSRMNAHGVTCSDCHDPHSGSTRAKGNALCAQCHSAEKYDSPAHDHHVASRATPRNSRGSRGTPVPTEESGPTCVSCHMPAATYMQVDSRRDHSIRIPRPDLSVKLGTPNACSSCHTNRSAGWAATRIAEWHVDTTLNGFQRSTTAIARASALAELMARDDRGTLDTLSKGLADHDPLVRLGALQGARRLPAERRAAFVAPLLSDPVASVRIDAMRLQTGAGFKSSEQQAAFQRVASEYVVVQQFNADRADARTNLGTFYAELGDLTRAETELRTAIRLDPFFPPAYVNLADVFRAAPARDAEAEEVLRAGLARAPGDATLHHALGLALIRLHRLTDARAELQRAASLDPRNVRFGYVYAVSLESTGRKKDAIAELERVQAIDPEDPDVRIALSVYRGSPPPR